MAEDQAGSPLERLERKLYAPKPVDEFAAPHLKNMQNTGPSGWSHPEAPPLQAYVKKPGMSGATMFLIGAFVFFILAGGVAAWLLIGGGRSVSTDHITITVEGPTTIAGGDTVPLLISLKNGNPVAITDANITIDFPDGTYSADQNAKPLTHLTEALDPIPAGATEAHTVRAVLFGNENQHVTIPITLEYKTEGSNAVFVKKSEYDVVIGTSPVSVNVQTLSEVASGQPITLLVSIRSNSPTPLDNVAVVASYPFGFSATAVDPQPTTGTLFTLGALAPGEEKKIKITGTLTGTDNEQRVFHFDVGQPQSSGGKLAVTYNGNDVPVTVTKPFLGVRLSINQSEQDPIIIQSSDNLQAQLTWENTLSNPIQDAQISIALGGSALDSGNVFSSSGFFRSTDNTILFSSDKEPSLKLLNPGDGGNGSFSLQSKTGPALASLRNPTITLAVSVAGRRVGESGVANQVSSTITRTLKVATDFLMSSRTVRTTGPFANTGPWPPVANQASTYTVMLTATNSVNSVADAAATMTLPSYVKFTGQVSGSVTYNENTRVVTWDLGDVPAGVSRDAAFQVSITPSTSQKGTSPVIVGEQTLSGYDRFISRQVKSAAPALDIRSETDPAYQFSFGAVKQ